MRSLETISDARTASNGTQAMIPSHLHTLATPTVHMRKLATECVPSPEAPSDARVRRSSTTSPPTAANGANPNHRHQCMREVLTLAFANAAKARDEISAFGKYYDYCVVNENVENAGREAQAIVTAIRCSSVRRRPRVEELLASFGGKD